MKLKYATKIVLATPLGPTNALPTTIQNGIAYKTARRVRHQWIIRRTTSITIVCNCLHEVSQCTATPIAPLSIHFIPSLQFTHACCVAAHACTHFLLRSGKIFQCQHPQLAWFGIAICFIYLADLLFRARDGLLDCNFRAGLKRWRWRSKLRL